MINMKNNNKIVYHASWLFIKNHKLAQKIKFYFIKTFLRSCKFHDVSVVKLEAGKFHDRSYIINAYTIYAYVTTSDTYNRFLRTFMNTQ